LWEKPAYFIQDYYGYGDIIFKNKFVFLINISGKNTNNTQNSVENNCNIDNIFSLFPNFS
jgi:hypothetical protein